jgi:hypothetical protein
MWKLDRPINSAGSTYLACVSRVRNAGLKARLEAVEQDVIDASDAFEVAAATAALHTLAHTALVGGDITKVEMSAVYTYRFAKKGAPGRAIYDELMAAPAHGRCPLCGQRSVTTLDHHLPKAHFPALAVAPLNLVPACADCNKAKIDAVPHSSAEETLHPYFDEVENDLWLKASVLEIAPAALRFYVAPHKSWDNVTTARVRHHFKLLKLSDLYATQGAEELLSIRHELANLYAKAGADVVKDQLADRAESCRRARINSWRTASYEALSANDWFCEGGFALDG